MKDNVKFSRWFFTVIAILILILSVYNIVKVPSRPSDECTWEDSKHGVQIISVKSDGSADVAGMRVGDIVLKIAGENATSSSRAQQILENHQPGQTVQYMVMRDVALVRLDVLIVRGGLSILYCIMWSVGVVFWLVGLWIILMRPLDPKARILYALFMIFMIFWTLTYIPPLTGIMEWIVLVLNILSFTGIPSLFLYFFLIYPTRHPILDRSRWIYMLLFAPTLLIVIWFFFASVFQHPSPINFSVGLFFWGIYFLIGMSRLGEEYRRIEDAQLKQQINVLRIGLGIGLLLPLFMIIPDLIGINFPNGRYFAPGMVIIPLVFAYVIIRHRLMDFEFIVKKSFVYTLLTGLIVGFYFIIVQIVGRVIQDQSGLTGSAVLIFSTLLIAIMFAPLREKIQKTVDRAFYKDAYDVRETLRQFARALNTLIEPHILAETVLEKICTTMHISKGYFFSVDDACCCCTCIQAYPCAIPQKTVRLDVDSFFCEHLQQSRSPILMTDIGETNSDIDTLISNWNCVVAVPLIQLDRLQGVILLGKKRSDTHYSLEDLELLATVGDQVAVALENGQLHRALTDQERLKRELEIARQIQMNSLPQKDPHIDGFDIHGYSIPAKEVGGDYYDYLQISDGKLGIVIGDVSGKGTSAALYMSKIQGFFRALIDTIQTPKLLLDRVNRLSYENVEEKSFMTLTVAILDPAAKTMTLSRAGHTPILHYQHQKQQCTEWTPKGIGLAMDKGDLFEKTLDEICLPLEKEDVLFFYTDGLSEAINPDKEEFGEDRLKDLLKQYVDADALTLSQSIITNIQYYCQDVPQQDDMTLVILKVLK